MTRDELFELTDTALLKRCRIDYFRAPGPGGQRRNKVDSGVRLTLKDFPKITAIATERRSQYVNSRQALIRLRRAIAYELRNTATPTWNGRLKFNVENREYPRFLALILDALAQNKWRMADAARAMNLTTGKLNKITFGDPQLWDYVNRTRESLGMSRLRPPR